MAPDFSGFPDWPGWQSTKYSPISDCGRDWQVASERNAPNPFTVACTVTTAWKFFWSRSIELIFPAGTPATLNCASGTRPNALSNSSL